MKVEIGDVSDLGIESERVSNFFKDHWKRKIALSIPEFYLWQFTKSPSDCGNDHCMVAVDNDAGCICGVMGLNRRPFNLDGQIKNGAELTTWIVDEKYIGKGIGAKILMKIQEKYEVLIGMGISEMALPIYLRSDFRYIRSLPRFVKVFNFEKIEKSAEYTSLAKKLADKWRIIPNVSFNSNSDVEEGISGCLRFLNKEFNYFNRETPYLSWRYSNHPMFQYHQRIVFGRTHANSGGCYIAFRVDKNIEGMNILHVMDFFGDTEDFQPALSFINKFSLENDIHIADFYCTSSKINRFFLSNGWFSINDDYFFQFPHLFNPLELRNPPTTSFIYWSRNDFSEMADIGKLYVTKQDADLDRPTVHTYEKQKSDGEGIQ